MESFVSRTIAWCPRIHIAFEEAPYEVKTGYAKNASPWKQECASLR